MNATHDLDSLARLNRPNLPRMKVLGVGFDNIDGGSAIDRIEALLQASAAGDCHRVLFLNVHSIWSARHDSQLAGIINGARLVLGDGSGIAIAVKLFGSQFVENLNGTDFMPRLIARVADTGWSIFLIGGKQDVSQNCQKHLQDLYPKLRIVGARSGYFSAEDETMIREEINRVKPDILLVGMGSPRQEYWMDRNSTQLTSKVCIGVGGLFDFLSGTRKRAPVWMRRAGIEFVYRFVQDPFEKWHRVMIETPWFLARVVLESVGRALSRALNIRW